MKCPFKKITKYTKRKTEWNARVGHYETVVPCTRDEAEYISEELQDCIGIGCQAFNGNGGGCKLLTGEPKGDATCQKKCD